MTKPYKDIEVTYKSKNDETVIKLLGTNLTMDFENETIVLGSKGGLNNFYYYLPSIIKIKLWVTIIFRIFRYNNN